MSGKSDRRRPTSDRIAGSWHPGFGWITRLFADDTVTAFTRWVIRRRWAVIVAVLLVAAGAGAGVLRIGFANDYRVFFSDDNPQLSAFEELQNVYTKDDNIVFVIKPDEGDVFTPGMLEAIRGLTEASWQIPFSTRVDSLTNFQNSYAAGDDLTVEDLAPRRGEITPEIAGRVRAVALSEPLLLDRLVSPDGTTTAVVATLNMPQLSADEGPQVMAFARGLAEQFRAENPSVHLAITGLAPLNNAFNEAAQRDMGALVPLMYAVLLMVMAVLLRSVSGTFTALAVIALSTIAAMGLAGWAGIKLTPPSAIAPTVILTIAIADSIHLLVTLLKEMRRGLPKNEAMVESMRVNFHPVFLTSLTTVIGFLSLNFGDTPPFHDLGNMTATGVVAAWLLSIILLPALVAVLPFRVKARAETAGSNLMERFADFVIGRRRLLLFGVSVSVILLGAMIPKLELNDQFVSYFDESIPFRVDTDFAMKYLSGIYQLNWSLPSQGPGGISDPDYLARVDAFSEWLRGQPGVVHVFTLTDVFRRLNRNMHGDDPEWYRLPEERDLAAQYLLLYEMSLPYGLDLNNQINVEKSAIRLVATTDNITTNEVRALDDRALAWLGENLPTAAKTRATGPFIMFAYIIKRNTVGMLTGTAIAFLLISASLIIALRNLKLGLVSLIPNILPAAAAFGIWSIFVGQVDIAASIVTAVSLGLIVDATVHFLSKYLRARRQRGESPEEAVRYAFSTVGTALWVASVILVAGFGVLVFSTFKMNYNMGLLTAISIAAALAIDFLLLPALLMLVDRETSGRREALASNAVPATQPAE